MSFCKKRFNSVGVRERIPMPNKTADLRRRLALTTADLRRRLAKTTADGIRECHFRAIKF
ncbi:MAG: hypothetical protein ACRCUY_13015 [Thermoguttaceae bacterium]